MTVSESVRWRPHAALRPYVAHYVGYRQLGLPAGTHRGLPSPYLTMILALDGPLTVTAHSDPRQPGGDYGTLIGGLHTAPVQISHPGRQLGVQLAVNPAGARALFGLPSGELTGIDLHAADLLGPAVEELRERMALAGSWAERFSLLDAALLRRTHDAPVLPGEVTHAWHRLLRTGGATGIGELAREVGWSGRHLGNRFNTEIGLSPKAAARVIRFHAVCQRLKGFAVQAQRPTLAEVAADCGYYDQAHLAREFGALAGCPPSRWLAEEVYGMAEPEFLNVQARDAGQGAGSPA